MLGLYAQLHWNVLMRPDKPIDDELLKQGCIVLSELHWLRLILAVLAIVTAVWSFRGRPLWSSVGATVLAVTAGRTVFMLT
jgi:hypothetical protein